MSISEIKMFVNSNTSEPLNFCQYINDISMFGSDSYVLAEQNKTLFRSLLKKSSIMFGHSKIHDIIYERMTSEDIDCMLIGDVGKKLNAFYDTTSFLTGGFYMLLSGMTVELLNKLEPKIAEGICNNIDNILNLKS